MQMSIDYDYFKEREDFLRYKNGSRIHVTIDEMGNTFRFEGDYHCCSRGELDVRAASWEGRKLLILPFFDKTEKVERWVARKKLKFPGLECAVVDLQYFQKKGEWICRKR